MLPALYHAHLEMHPDDLLFWLELARQQDGPILELGCGTGRLLSVLAKAGHKIFGLDNDYKMLAYLGRNLTRQSSSRQNIFQADFTRFHLGLSFSLIFMPCNTMSTIPASDRLMMLLCARRHLQPDGVFAASLPNPEVLLNLPPHSDPEVEEVLPHPDTGEPVQVLSAWERSEGRFTVLWHYDHLQTDGHVRRESLEVSYYLTSAQIYQDELKQAGFHSITLYGGYDRSAYQNDSPLLVFLASVEGTSVF